MKSAIKMPDSYFSKFDPRIYQMTGCPRATLILDTLEYWFIKYPDGFYKFIGACSHRLYKEGDSWTEQLGCDSKSFSTSFKKIGTKYASRTAFENAEDRFKGKMYASFYDRYTNQTFFVRNHELANTTLLNISQNNRKNSPSRLKEISDQDTEKFQIRIGRSSRSYIETKNTTKNTTKTTSSLPTLSQEVEGAPSGLGRREEVSVSPQVESSQDSQDVHTSPTEVIREPEVPNPRMIHEQMLLTFNRRTGRNEIRSPFRDQDAAECLEMEFGGSMEEWEKYCVMISQNDFEMGRAVTRKPYMLWFRVAIKPEKIVEIRDKHVFRVELATTNVENPGTTRPTSLTFMDVDDKIDASDEPELVRQIRKEILSEVDLNPYKSWFDTPKATMQVIDGKLLLTAQTKFIENWINDKYEKKLRDILEKHGLSLSIVSAQRVDTVPTPRQIIKEFYPARGSASFQKITSGLFKMPSKGPSRKDIDPNDEDIEAKKAEYLQAYGLANNYSPTLHVRSA